MLKPAGDSVMRTEDTAHRAGIERPRRAHIWMRADDDFYVEPHWCDERLFEVEDFDRRRLLLDPCCGSGRITSAARAAGYTVEASDLVDRGLFAMDRAQDFLKRTRVPTGCSIVCNPPFDLVEEFALKGTKSTNP